MFWKQRTSMFEQIRPMHLDYNLHYPRFHLIYGFFILSQFFSHLRLKS